MAEIPTVADKYDFLYVGGAYVRDDEIVAVEPVYGERPSGTTNLMALIVYTTGGQAFRADDATLEVTMDALGLEF